MSGILIYTLRNLFTIISIKCIVDAFCQTQELNINCKVYQLCLSCKSLFQPCNQILTAVFGLHDAMLTRPVKLFKNRNNEIGVIFLIRNESSIDVKPPDVTVFTS